MRHTIIGLDPGLNLTGWGIIEVNKTKQIYIAHGVISPKKNNSTATRLSELHNELLRILNVYKPSEAVVEETFVNNNPLSTLKLGMARGVVLMTPALLGIKVSEYTATCIKKSVVGVGHANKEQIIWMIKKLLPDINYVTSDSADALAVAICHANHQSIKKYDHAS